MPVWTGKDMVPYFRNPGTIPMEIEGPLRSDQVQPNGIDLRLDKIFEVWGSPSLSSDPAFTEMPMHREILPGQVAGLAEEGWYLDSGTTKGYYLVEWLETIEIPPNAVGLISPRSTLLRMGAWMAGSVWDRGYKGKGRSGLIIKQDLLLERGVRLAQMIFMNAKEDDTLYDGQYQHEQIQI